MRFLNDWLPDSLLQALGWTLVHSLWQLVLIAALLWGILKLVHRSKPAVKYILAVGALVLAVLAGASTFVYEINEAENHAAFSAGDFQNLVTAPLFSSSAVGMEATTVTVTRWINQYIPFLVNIWFLGSLLFLFRLVNSLSEIRGLRKSSTPVSDFQLEKIAYRLVSKIGIKTDVQLRISQFGISPLTFGTLRPIILLPAGLIFQLSPTQLEAIIAHELAHVKRHDYLINMVLSGLEVIFFYHPCYWWMNQTVKELRENAADDLAIKAGIEPKDLATGLAQVLNFAWQNPPELALAAGKKRNPTLLRIKRMLGYQTENYTQTPIISIPMLLTLFLSAALMASAQQDAPKSGLTRVEKNLATQPAQAIVPVWDTIPTPNLKSSKTDYHRFSITTDDGKTYHIIGDKLISGKDTLALSPKVIVELEKLEQFDAENMPELSIPDAPEFQDDWFAPMPDYDLDIPLPPDPLDPPFESFEFEDLSVWNFSFGDTSKMSKDERERWRKEIESMTKEGANHTEKMSKEWEKKWRENESVRQEKMAEWEAKFQQEFQPKLKEFEQKMKAWQEANEPKIKEFESKIKEWQAAQEPKMKEFELKMKEWETAQKPKMEEFQKKMELWQKEHQAKLQEFQKLLQEELNKDQN
jgi:beta-lactamase regulating signal transducer with metallopeptidase domain